MNLNYIYDHIGIYLGNLTRLKAILEGIPLLNKPPFGVTSAEVTYETSFPMRGASKVTLQTHQVLRLPRNL